MNSFNQNMNEMPSNYAMREYISRAMNLIISLLKYAQKCRIKNLFLLENEMSEMRNEWGEEFKRSRIEKFSGCVKVAVCNGAINNTN